MNFTPKILFHLPNFPMNSSLRIFFLEFLGISFPSFPWLKLQQLLILLSLQQLQTILVSQLLIVKNYQTWSRSMIMALTAKTKISFVNGTIYQWIPSYFQSLDKMQHNGALVDSQFYFLIKDVVSNVIIYLSGWIFKRGLRKGMQLESFSFRRQSHFLLKISPFWVLTLLGLKNFGMSYLITRPSLIIVFKNTLSIFQYCFQSNLDHFLVGITSKLSR